MVYLRQSCDVVIVNYNAGQYLRDAVVSARNSPDVATVFVVDNASTDGSLASLKTVDLTGLQIIRNDANLGFAKAANLGIDRCRSDAVLVLNPDCRIDGDAVVRLVAALGLSEKVGMVGPLLLNPNGSEQAGGRRVMPTPEKAFARAMGLLRLRRFFPNLISDFALHEEPLPKNPVEVEAISGACMLASRTAIEEVGPFDERYFLHCEDLDWCMRMRQRGYSILFVPQARVFHQKGVSSSSRPYATEYYKHRGMVRFYRKFFRDQYPWMLFYGVLTAVWVRYLIVCGRIAISKTERSPI